MLDALRSMWWATLAIGIIAVLFGLVAVLMPTAALAAIIVLAAIYALLSGIFAVIGGIRGIAHDAGGWLELLWGFVGIVLGLYVIFEPRTAAVVLFLLFGLWAVLRGALEVIAAIRLRHTVSGWVVTLIGGIAWAGLGVLFLIAPSAVAIATTVVWGVFLMLIGVITIVSAAFVHRAINSLEDEASAASGLM